MSDLDADLYGDLYGNDDEGLQPVTGEPESPKEESSTATAVPAQSSAVAKTVSTEPAGTSARTVPAPATQQSLAKPVVPAPPQAQAIQTYQERNEPAAMLPQQAYNTNVSSPLNGDSAQIPVGERSVRPSEMKDEGKMFIGGLNWDTTDEGLKAYFEQFGKVDACTIMRDATGRSRCFAFLTFEDAASVNAVMVREHFLDGKVIDPKRAIPRQEHQRATKLFIGGLAGTVTSESMREFFSQFGKVIDSTVMLDRETGRSKGFGFISLEDADVTPILGFGNLEIDGKLIDIKLAQPRHQRDNQEGGFTNNQQQQQPQQNNRTNNFTNTANVATPQAGTPFDPQALATLYTRMFQVNGGMNMMGGGMNPMGMGNGMGNGMGMGMNPMMMDGGMGMGGMGMGMNGGGMGRGGAPMGRGGHMGMNPAMGMGMGNVPRGPRNAGQMGAPAMGGGMGGGPQRTGQRGQHNYHPYAR